MSNEAWVDFVAGWISGGVSVLACQPIDTVLTRLQANTAEVRAGSTLSDVSKLSKLTSTDVAETVALRPSNIFKGMVSNFGVQSLWRGSSAMIGAVPIQNALLMSGYGAGKRWSDSTNESSEDSKKDVLLGVFVGGCTGGVLQSFVMSPVELIKVSQQVAGKSVTSATASVARGLFSPSGAWRGLGATLLRDGIPHGVWFVAYEVAKTKMTLFRENSNGVKSPTQDNIAIPMLSGAFAATVAWLVGYPFDLIKTRIQAGSGEGIVGTARDLVNESGGRIINGLYKGFTWKLYRSIPASAIGFLAYETAAKALN